MISPFFREFITDLANCDKIVVGAVFGFVNGLGVAMLPYFDFVYASDTSTFCLPYANLGQSTEGGLARAAKCSNIPDALVMSNHYVKYKKKKVLARHLLHLQFHKMKIADTRITADVAAQFGLVSESFWQNNFQDVVLQRTVAMARDAKVCGFIFYCVNIENM